MTILLTPRAMSRISDEVKGKINEQYPDITWSPTSAIYINMTGGWTEEQCDDIAYIVDEKVIKCGETNF